MKRNEQIKDDARFICPRCGTKYTGGKFCGNVPTDCWNDKVKLVKYVGEAK